MHNLVKDNNIFSGEFYEYKEDEESKISKHSFLINYKVSHTYMYASYV